MPNQSLLHPSIRVAPSPIHELGLFATSAIPAGAVVGIMGGREISDQELAELAGTGARYDSAAIGEGRNLLIDSEHPLARGNHSCDSSLWMRDAFTLEARRDIAPGDEVTIDYALMTVVPWEMACRCGSVACRGTVRGSDWMRNDVQERYRGHFSPFINERIARSAFVVDAGVLVDRARGDRRLPWTVWRPRDPTNAPLIVYSHSSYGHRAVSSYLTTHLASHGYVVAAVDHTGNTRAEWVPRSTPLEPAEREAFIAKIIGDRVPDIRRLIDHALATYPVDPSRIGLVGWSFGGWAVLATPEEDDRVSSVVALAPGGARDPLPGIIPSTQTFAWTREVATLVIAAERDRFIPVDRARDVFERAPLPKRWFVLPDADHGHFSDTIEMDGPATPEVARDFVRTLTLAHFDATLRGDDAAKRLLLASERVA